MYERILVATDGSPLSDKAVSHALSIAKMNQATLIALKVVPRYPRSYLEGGATVDPSEIKRIEAQWTEQAQAVLSEPQWLTALPAGTAVQSLVRVSVRVEPVVPLSVKESSVAATRSMPTVRAPARAALIIFLGVR